jgi:hypothetical protein
MREHNTEVLILESTIQVFSNANYLGEYCGRWQSGAIGGPTVTGLAQPVPQKLVKHAVATHGAGYDAPGPVAQRQLVAPTMERSAAAVGSARPAKPQGLDRSPDKVQKLCDAAKNGDVEGVHRLLESGIDPDGASRDGRTPLMAAATGGHLRVVQALLAAYADPNVGKGADTPLTIAFQKGNQDILKALFGASFNALDNMVLSTSGFTGVSAHGYSGGIIEAEPASVPDSAMDNLRHVTAKLASVSSDRRDISPFRQTARYGNYGDKVMLEPKKGGEIREQAVRLTMRSLKSSHKE